MPLTLLTTLADLNRQGDYLALARRISRLSPRRRAEPALALEIATAFLCQGEVFLARSALAHASQCQASPRLRLRIQLEQAFADLLADEPVAACLANAEKAWAAAGQLPERDKRLAEIPWRRLQLAAAVQFEISREQLARSVASLEPLAAALEAQGCVEEALKIQLMLAERQPGTDQQLAALSELAVRADRVRFPEWAAHARLSRARLMLASDTPFRDIQAELDTAARHYSSAGHRQGPVEVARLRAQARVERRGAALKALTAYLSDFRQGRYIKGELSLLLDLAQLALERGDTARAEAFRQRSQRLARRSGLLMTLNDALLAQVDQLHRHSHYRAAIELCHASLTETPSRFMAASLEQSLGTTYGFLAQPHRATKHLQRALDQFEAMGNAPMASQVAQLLAMQLTQQHDHATPEAIALLVTWQRRDLARGDVAALVAKLDVQVQMLQTDASMLPIAHHLLDTGERLADRLSGRDAARQLGNLQQLRSLVAQREGDKAGALEALAGATATYRQAGMAMQAANCRYMIGIHHLDRLHQAPDELTSLAWDALNQALAYYSDSGMRQQAVDTRYMLALLLFQQLGHFDAEGKKTRTQQALALLADGEAELDAIRSDFATGQALESLHGKRQLRQQSQRLYDLALQLATASQPTDVSWQWVQHAKARALCDTLGSGSLLTSRLQTMLQAHPDAQALAQQEHDLVARRQQAPPGKRFALSAELDELRQRMANHPLLHELLALRRGETPPLASLPGLLAPHAGAAPGTLLVDWVSVGGRLHLMTLRPGEPPTLTLLPLLLDRVAAFVRDNLGPRHFRDTLHLNPRLLNALDSLITPLAWLAQPGERLVLSPTGPMHAVPLHALTLAGDALIARHPMVVSPSLGVLRHCLLRASDSPAFRRVVVFGDPQGDLPDAAMLVTALARQFAIQPLRGSAVTRDAFRQRIQGCDLIHYQGHARFDPSDPLDSQLMLADGPLSAREIFAVSGLTAPLVTLAACESAVSEVTVGDEPLGLIPAFLQAGARAVLATQWRTNARSSARLIEHLHAAIRRQDDQVDLSKALQEAILTTRDTPNCHTPYHWAPFILYGGWQ